MTTHSEKDLDRAAVAILNDLNIRANHFTNVLRNDGHARAIGLDPAELAYTRLPPMTRAAVGFAQLQQAWRREPTVCTMHPDLMVELRDVEHHAVPSAMLDQLAFRSPRIVFPVPIPCVSVIDPHGRGEVIAAQITGRRWAHNPNPKIPAQNRAVLVPCHTTHPDRVQHYLTIFTRYSGLRGDGDGLEMNSIELPTSSVDEFHPEDLVQEGARQELAMAATQDVFKQHPVEQHIEAMMTRLWPVMDALLYLSSHSPDLAPATERGGKKAQRARRKPGELVPNVTNVGFHKGPLWGGQRRAWEAHERTAARGGHRLAHPRRAHYRKWPLGRRADQVFVSPTYVNLNLSDEGDVPTLVPVGRME